MASVVEKLYPPVIGGSLPACFKNDDGAVVITVPFSMNRAVDSSLVDSFRLKIKTVQSNTYIKTLIVDSTYEALTNRIATFTWRDFDESKVKIGQYLKVQLAYVGKDTANTVGYFSTVGVIKYTSKPNVYIEGLGQNANQIEAFRQTYLGVFETGEDKSERPYAYNFYLYDSENQLIETSGWTLHNTSINNIASESLSLDRATDSYTFQTIIKSNEEYYLQDGVRTINNLEVFSPIYTCIEPYIGPSEFYTDLIAENNFEEEYIELSLKMKDNDELLELFPGDYVITDNENNEKLIYQQNGEEPNINNDTLIKTISYEAPESPTSIEICRSERTDGFQSWRVLQKVYFADYASALAWSFKDLTIEQGITYQYCYRQYNENGVQSARTLSNKVYADFEDMFLWDGKKQLKIRFNPKVSSFKIDRLEQKMDTIGSRYPFFFRNGVVQYREFPIAGLISYLADNNEMFLNYYEDLNIIRGPMVERTDNPVDQTVDDTGLGKSWELSETLNSVGYNMHAERIFKMRLLEWLGNGEIKMFKSAAEGNFLVRIMNVSLTPEDKLGRMIHNFSCTAYEVEELTYENLLDLKFIVPVDTEKRELRYDGETHLWEDKISTITNIANSVLLNDYAITDYLYLQPSPNVEGGPGFFVRIGEDIADKKAYVQQGFILKADNSELPSIWFNIQDNADLLEELGLEVSVESAQTLVGDATLYYWYYRTSVITGELYNIENVYVRNDIKTISGPAIETFHSSNIVDSQTVEEEALKFFVLNFHRKPVKEIGLDNGVYYDIDTEEPIPNSALEVTTLYKIDDSYHYVVVNPTTGVKSLSAAITGGPDDNTTIVLTDSNNTTHTFTEPPIINLNEDVYRSIQIGASIYLDCAYQVKVTTYKAG